MRFESLGEARFTSLLSLEPDPPTSLGRLRYAYEFESDEPRPRPTHTGIKPTPLERWSVTRNGTPRGPMYCRTVSHFAQLSTAWLLLLWVAPSVAGQPPHETPTADDEREHRQAELAQCFATAQRTQPALVVDTPALLLARGGQPLFVDIELPEAPALAACFTRVLMNHPAPGPAVHRNALSVGSLQLRFSVPENTPVPRESLSAFKDRQARFQQRVLERGLLEPSDPLYREWVSPKPPWPGPAQLAELDTCYRAALPTHPNLILHRNVFYLERAGKVLLADVLVPEAPALAHCLTNTMTTWVAPFVPGSNSRAVVSSFFIDLGAPPEFPDRLPGYDLLKHRDELLKRAVDSGLLDRDDPLVKLLDRNSSMPSP